MYLHLELLICQKRFLTRVFSVQWEDGGDAAGRQFSGFLSRHSKLQSEAEAALLILCTVHPFDSLSQLRLPCLVTTATCGNALLLGWLYACFGLPPFIPVCMCVSLWGSRLSHQTMAWKHSSPRCCVSIAYRFFSLTSVSFCTSTLSGTKASVSP